MSPNKPAALWAHLIAEVSSLTMFISGTMTTTVLAKPKCLPYEKVRDSIAYLKYAVAAYERLCIGFCCVIVYNKVVHKAFAFLGA